MNNTFSDDLFNKMPIIGILRNVPSQHLEDIAKNYHQSGLTCLEITMNSPNAGEDIASLVKLYGNDLNIGAGTVCTLHDLEKALKANAQFIVTPIVNDDVIKACVEANVPVFPGAYTPTEIYKAWSLGAAMVKVFPATKLGAGYIKEVLGPLGHLKLIPTGGINFDNFTDFFEAGAIGVGIGSHLFPKNVIENKDQEKLSEIFSTFTKKYTAYFNGKV
jgi:2-dehydro-3-deoxyphosphogluconate aldolase/(4S)-4-hydroxy-2-oxoglutarate aldolase